MVNKIYLDHHTTTRPSNSSIEAMLSFFRDRWGSITAPHQRGQELISPMDQSKEAIFEVLGAKKEDRFYFFSSNAEAIHHVYQSHYLDYIRRLGKNHIVTTSMEDASILMPLKHLEELGCHVKILAVNSQGQFTKEILEEALRPRTSLVSISWANGLTGVIHPIEDLAEACREKDVLFHVDASYVIGKHFFHFEDLKIDFLTFEGRLLHAPQGTAGLIVKKQTMFSTPVSSTIGVPVGGVVSLAKGLEEVEKKFEYLCLETARLRDKLERGIQQGISGSKVLFQKAERLPNCSAIAFPGVNSEALLFLLNRKGICASMGGGHCQKLSDILIGCGYDQTLAQSALSFSLSFETTEEEIDCAVKIIVECTQMLQRLSLDLLRTRQ